MSSWISGDNVVQILIIFISYAVTSLYFFSKIRAFVVNGELQNISDISFDRVGELRLNIQNIDFGNKRFVFNDVNYLTISGNLGK